MCSNLLKKKREIGGGVGGGEGVFFFGSGGWIFSSHILPLSPDLVWSD